jgi:NAD(P)-dependent dehydrogenase (short-subunit alcohol dehydrogenase family)
MTRPLMRSEEWLKQTQGVTPAGRLGMPEEIASVVVFLASDAARFTYGQNVVVHGELAIKLA